jgi:hypothetical protein
MANRSLPEIAQSRSRKSPSASSNLSCLKSAGNRRRKRTGSIVCKCPFRRKSGGRKTEARTGISSGVRSQESGVRSQESGVRSQESGAGSREPGAGSREPGAGSREPGAGSREPGARSREPGARSQEPGRRPAAICHFFKRMVRRKPERRVAHSA